MATRWRGVFPAIATQFDAEGALDLAGTARHIESQLAAGVSGVIVLGSLGENTALDPDEKRRVLETAVHAVAGRIPILSGVAESSLTAAKRWVRQVEELGADGYMLMPAIVYRTSPEETLAWYRDVAAASGLPVLIYNNPVGYGTDLTPELLERLADEPDFVAVKESSADVRRLTDIINRLGDRYALFNGVDDLALEAVLLGAVGWVAGLADAFPRENALLWELATSGDWARARELYRWYMPLLHLDAHPKFVQYIKLAMKETGEGAEWVRPPRRLISGEERDRVLEVIRKGIETRPALPTQAGPSRAQAHR